MLDARGGGLTTWVPMAYLVYKVHANYGNENGVCTWYCCKGYPGLGNIRSVFHPPLYRSSVGDTITFDVVEDTDSNLTSNVYLASFIETLARASLNKYLLPGPPGIETKRLYRSAYGRTQPDASKISPFREGGSVIRNTLGWIIDQLFYPTNNSSVCNTFEACVSWEGGMVRLSTSY